MEAISTGSRMTDVLPNWEEMSEDLLKEWARQYLGWATNEMSDPDELEWTLERQFPLSDFKKIHTDWDSYYKDDVLLNPRYDSNFASETWHTPVVISLENDGIIIWDGWHRIATSIARGNKCIRAITGREKKP